MCMMHCSPLPIVELLKELAFISSGLDLCVDPIMERVDL